MDMVLLGKFSIALLCGGLTILLLLHPGPQRLSPSQFTFFSMGLLLLSRLAVFIGIFFVLGQDVTSDVALFYYPNGLRLLEGEAIYRDIQSSYGPLFLYVIAGVLLVWNSAKAVLLFAILIEAISLPLWLRAGRDIIGERVTRRAALLYVASPVPLLNVALNGQNQVWVSVLMALALCLMVRRNLISGVAHSMTLILVKLLGLLFAPALWLYAQRRFRWLIGFVAPLVIVYGIFIALDLDVLVPVRLQGDLVTSGNVFYLMTLAGLDLDVPTVRHLATGLLLGALVFVFLASWVRGDRRQTHQVFHLLTLILLTTLLLSKKSYASYLVMAFFPLCITLASRPIRIWSLLCFAAFGILAALEPSLWFRWLDHGDFGHFELLIQSELPEGLQRGRIVIFLIWDILLLICYAGYFLLAWKRLRQPVEEL